MGKLAGKVAIITGSSMGIGKVLARQMAEAQVRVVLNARNEQRLQKSLADMQAQGYDMHAIAADVSKEEGVRRLIEGTIQHYGRLDYLINNAGISMEGTLEELDSAVFQKLMDVNVMGSVIPTQIALPQLRKNRGSVIFIGSVAGIRGIPGYSPYSASKMALTAIAESLKSELDGSGVHVGIAYVGFTENDPQKTIYDKSGQIIPQPKRDFIKAESPENVARRIISMIKNRRFKQVFTPLGKINAWMNRFFPRIVDFVLTRNFKKRNAG
ncbi:MAG: SDR family oxidoreductase [Bacteroidota bacterium]